MFDKKQKEDNDFSGRISTIADGSTVKGDIISQSDFRLDGELIGNFQSNGKIIIGPAGKIIGDVVCKNAEIEGRLEGKIKVEEILSIKSNGTIEGEVTCKELAVELGAQLKISCTVEPNEKNNNK